MLIFVSKIQSFIICSLRFYLTGGILFNYFSGLLFNYIIHADENKPHISDLIEFKDNLMLSENKDDKELLRLINEGKVELSYADGNIVVDGV